MKAFICDVCGKQQGQDEPQYGIPPKAWYSVRISGRYESLDVCSKGCAITLIEKEAPAPVQSVAVFGG